MWKPAEKLGWFFLFSVVTLPAAYYGDGGLLRIVAGFYRSNWTEGSSSSYSERVSTWRESISEIKTKFGENSTLSLPFGAMNSTQSITEFIPKGGVKGDPHFSGFDGSHFDFTGHPGKYYCLISDKRVHLNAYFGGRYAQWGHDPHHPLTWIYKFSLLWDDHQLIMTARTGSSVEYEDGFLGSIELDGKKIELGEKDQLELLNGQLELTWAESMKPNGDEYRDVYLIAISNVIIIEVNINPEIGMMRTADDAAVHFNLAFPVIAFTDEVHGVIGQTYRPDRKHMLGQQKLVFNNHLQWDMVQGDNAEGFLEGEPSDYETSGLLSTDCKFSMFKVYSQ